MLDAEDDFAVSDCCLELVAEDAVDDGLGGLSGAFVCPSGGFGAFPLLPLLLLPITPNGSKSLLSAVWAACATWACVAGLGLLVEMVEAVATETVVIRDDVETGVEAVRRQSLRKNKKRYGRPRSRSMSGSQVRE